MTETTGPAGTDAPPTCYRHTDRETYVRCTRCDRSICPDCMSAAAVGFQCPECVREGRKTVRQPRTMFGGRVGADANVTKVLIALNVMAFAAQLASDKVTARFFFATPAVAILDQYYRLLTNAFLHDTSFVFHLGFNMYALFAFGSQVERLLGSWRYLTLYLTAALGGSVATYVFASQDVASLGASGAVFGLFGAYFVLARSRGADTSQVLMLIGINLAIGFAGRGYINNYAHVGGLVAGGLVALGYTLGARSARRGAIHAGIAAAIVAALVAATIARTEYLRGQYDAPRTVAISSATSAPEQPSR